MSNINVTVVNVLIMEKQGFILGIIVIGVVSHAGKSKERKMKKPKRSKKLAGWMFNELYWFDMNRTPRKRWKEELKKRYVLIGKSKKFPKGTFKKTWMFIKKEGLIREGSRGKQIRRRRE